VQLQEKYPERIHAITLNIEFDGEGEPTEELQEKVRSMLSRRGISCESILCSDQLKTTMSELEVAGLPAVLIFNAEGELIRKFDSDFGYEEQVTPLIDALVNGTSSSDPNGGKQP
jgi:hypothetical protein